MKYTNDLKNVNAMPRSTELNEINEMKRNEYK